MYSALAASGLISGLPWGQGLGDKGWRISICRYKHMALHTKIFLDVDIGVYIYIYIFMCVSMYVCRSDETSSGRIYRYVGIYA